MRTDIPTTILERLGVDAVLLPIRAGSKAPQRRRWEQTTFQQTQTESYQEALRSGPAIGVLLGEPSQGLCSIDLDDDEALGRFLEANPSLRDALRTKGRRGANIWVVIDGEFPSSRNLTFNGDPMGEWRANGSQTVIAGRHPEGGEYTRLVDAPPARASYQEINWNAVENESAREIPLLASPPLSSSSVSSSLSVSSTSSTSPQSLGDKIRAAEAAKEALSGSLKRLYGRYIEKRYIPQQGSRNSCLIAMVTFLFRAVGVGQLKALATAFYHTNQDVFTDPPAQHLAEIEAHLRACEASWLAELTEGERAFISDLPQDYVDAFRICRDLASHVNNSCPPPGFFLTCNSLGDRLDCSPSKAQRILQSLEIHGHILTEQKGTRRGSGVPGIPTSFRWIAAVAVAVAATIIMICIRPITQLSGGITYSTSIESDPIIGKWEKLKNDQIHVSAGMGALGDR